MDPGGRVGEDQAGLPAVPGQRPQRDKHLVALVAAQRADGRGDIAGGDLAQTAIAGGPVQQARVDAAKVAADGAGLAGPGAWAAVPQGVHPTAGAGCDARGRPGEPGLDPGIEGGGAVIVEQPSQGDDLRGARDAQVAAAKRGGEG